MSNAIQFLETMGRHPLGKSSPEAYVEAIAALDVDVVLKQALLEKNGSELSSLLGMQPMMMLVWSPREDELQDDEHPVEEEIDDESPDEDTETPSE